MNTNNTLRIMSRAFGYYLYGLAIVSFGHTEFWWAPFLLLAFASLVLVATEMWTKEQ